MFCGDRPYSSRRASVGLTFEARHAGMNAAASAPAARTSGGGGDGRGVGSSDAEQLGLDELAERGDARERDGHAGGDHGDGVAQDEADSGSARRAKGEADADFAGAARDHEGHHSVETDQREQQRQRAEAAR